MNTDEIFLTPCRHCGNPGPLIDLICDNCGRVVLNYNRAVLLTLFIATLLAISLFHATRSLWPMYLLVMIAIIHLYAVIFSRGTALLTAAVATGSTAAVWILWEVGQTLSTFSLAPRSYIELWSGINNSFHAYLYWIALLIWLLVTLGAIGICRVTIVPGFKLATGYFLGTGAFVTGLWGFWGVVIQNHLALGPEVQIAVIMALLLPLVLLVVLLNIRPPRGTRGLVIAVWALILTVYLSTSQFLTNLTIYGLGHILPRLLGVEVHIRGVDTPALLRVLNVRNPIQSLLLALTIISLVVTSAIEEAAVFRSDEAGSVREWITRLQELRGSADHEFERIVWHAGGFAVELVWVICVVAVFTGGTTVLLVGNVIKAAKEGAAYLIDVVRFFIVPVLVFSLLSILVIVVLQEYILYDGSKSALSAQTLWGEGIAVMVLVVLLSGAVFGFARSLGQRFLFAGMEAVLLLGVLGYFLVSIASLVLPLVWLGFRQGGSEPAGIQPGPVYWINLVVATSVALALALVVMLARAFRLSNSEDTNRWPSKLRSVVQLIEFTLVGAIGVGGMAIGAPALVQAIVKAGS